MNLLLQFGGFIYWLLETLDENQVMHLRAAAEHDIALNQVGEPTRKALDFFIAMTDGKNWIEAEATAEAIEKFLTLED